MDVASIVVGIVTLVYLWMWAEMKHLVTCGYGWNFGTWLLVDVGRTEALGYLWMWLVFWHLFASESSQTWLFMEIARIVALVDLEGIVSLGHLWTWSCMCTWLQFTVVHGSGPCSSSWDLNSISVSKPYPLSHYRTVRTTGSCTSCLKVCTSSLCLESILVHDT